MSASVAVKQAYTARTGQSTYDSLQLQESALASVQLLNDIVASIETARAVSSAIGCRNKAQLVSSCCAAAFLLLQQLARCVVPAELIKQSIAVYCI
jgi:hypothetical protein